jgi:hypothetical protein
MKDYGILPKIYVCKVGEKVLHSRLPWLILPKIYVCKVGEKGSTTLKVTMVTIKRESSYPHVMSKGYSSCQFVLFKVKNLKSRLN